MDIFPAGKRGLAVSDGLAETVHNWAIGIAAAEGTGTGIVGLLAMPIDIPFHITHALRTIHKIGVCYGFEADGENDDQFVFGILSSASASSVEEKVAALAPLRSIQVTLAKTTWKKMAEKAVQNPICNETVLLTLKTLAKQLGVTLTKKKALAAIPVIGGPVGGTVNARYIRQVGWSARRAFQERWLMANKKVIEVST